jgi:hypothetical protein
MEVHSYDLSALQHKYNCDCARPQLMAAFFTSKNRRERQMIHDRRFRAAMALVLVTASAAPAFAQNRFMDAAREAANRREENKSVREAENPTGVASAAKPAAPEVAPAASPAAPAAPAEPTPAAAPATPAPAQ